MMMMIIEMIIHIKFWTLVERKTFAAEQETNTKLHVLILGYACGLSSA